MEVIKSQLVFLFGSFLSGVAVMLAYEGVNVLRDLFRLKILGKLLLDLLFFVISGVAVFQMVFLCNNGTLRSFFLFAFGAGAILYRITFGTRLSEGIVKAIRWGTHQLLRPLRWFCKKFSKKP